MNSKLIIDNAKTHNNNAVYDVKQYLDSGHVLFRRNDLEDESPIVMVQKVSFGTNPYLIVSKDSCVDFLEETKIHTLDLTGKCSGHYFWFSLDSFIKSHTPYLGSISVTLSSKVE